MLEISEHGGNFGGGGFRKGDFLEESEVEFLFIPGGRSAWLVGEHYGTLAIYTLVAPNNNYVSRIDPLNGKRIWTSETTRFDGNSTLFAMVTVTAGGVLGDHADGSTSTRKMAYVSNSGNWFRGGVTISNGAMTKSLGRGSYTAPYSSSGMYGSGGLGSLYRLNSYASLGWSIALSSGVIPSLIAEGSGIMPDGNILAVQDSTKLHHVNPVTGAVIATYTITAGAITGTFPTLSYVGGDFFYYSNGSLFRKIDLRGNLVQSIGLPNDLLHPKVTGMEGDKIFVTHDGASGVPRAYRSHLISDISQISESPEIARIANENDYDVRNVLAAGDGVYYTDRGKVASTGYARIR